MLHRNLKLNMKIYRNSPPYKPFKVIYIDSEYVRLEDERTGTSIAYTVKEFESSNWVLWE